MTLHNMQIVRGKPLFQATTVKTYTAEYFKVLLVGPTKNDMSTEADGVCRTLRQNSSLCLLHAASPAYSLSDQIIAASFLVSMLL